MAQADRDLEAEAQFSLKDIDRFNPSNYPSIKLKNSEYRRFTSEAMTWNADKVGKVLHQTLSDDYTYVYYFDEDHNIHLLNRYKATNIHERQAVIDGKRNRRKSDRNDGRTGRRGRNDSSDVFGNNRRAAKGSKNTSLAAQSEIRQGDRG